MGVGSRTTLPPVVGLACGLPGCGVATGAGLRSRWLPVRRAAAAPWSTGPSRAGENESESTFSPANGAPAWLVLVNTPETSREDRRAR